MDMDNCEFLRIVSLNVNGMGRNSNFTTFLSTFYNQLNNDIFMLQETHGCQKYENYWAKHFNHKLYFSHCDTNKGGLMLGISKKLQLETYKVLYDEYYMIVHCNVEGEDMVLANVYFPCGGSLPTFAELLQEFWVAVLQFKCERVIVGGDWNTTMYPEVDRFYHDNPVPSDYKAGVLRSFISGVQLSDVWRVFHPGERMYTRKRGTANSRIDMIMVSQLMLSYTVRTGMIPVACSDHDAVFLDIFRRSNVRGPGLWRFPNWLLELPSFVEFMNAQISMYFQSFDADETDVLDHELVARWEGFKGFARQQTMSFIRSWRKMTKRYRMVQLSQIILEFEHRSVDNLLEEEEREAWGIEAEKLRAQLLEVTNEKPSGIGRDQREVVLGKDMFAYIQCSPGRLAGVFHGDQLVTSPTDILSVCESFFSELYVDPNKIGGESFRLSNFNFVPEENLCREDTGDLITESFLMEDFQKALFRMKVGSAPGEDGLTAAFYKKFWSLIGKHVSGSLWAGIRSGVMSPTQRRGIVKLIPKPGKDPRYIKNLRPITLLNVDFKILTKAISMRLSPFMHQLVHIDQKGFVKGRYLGEQIFDIYAVEHIADFDDVLLLLDIRKAFDSVSWMFLKCRLHAYHFPEQFISLIGTLFKHKELRVYNNGFCSQPIFPTQGLAQGCSLSPLLLILAIEGLAYHIRNSPRFMGIPYMGREKRIGSVADDTALFMKFNEENLKNVTTILDHFAMVSGLKINVEKCELVILRECPRFILQDIEQVCRNLSCNYKVTSIRQGFTYLGIFICRRQPKADNSNFKHISKKVVAFRFSMLKRQMVCRLTRVSRTKALLFSKYVYRFTFANLPPKSLLKDLTSAAFDYIWENLHCINQKAMYLHQSKGGYGAMHIESHLWALRFRWLAKLCDPQCDEFWVFQLRQIKFMESPFLFLMRPEPIKRVWWAKIPLYWRDTIRHWFRVFQCNSFPVRCSPYEAFHKITQRRTVKQWLARGSSLILELFDRDMQVFLQNPVGNYQVISTDILMGNVSVKQIYQYLVSFVTEPRESAIKVWSSSFPELKYDVLYKNWECYTIKCKGIPVIRVRDFHIMFLNAAYPTSLSYRWCLNKVLGCPFCNSFNDTFVHRFWECRYVQVYWMHICDSILSYFEADFSEANICMGTFDIRVLNFIVTVAKYTILICGINKKMPDFCLFLIHLKYYYTTHRRIWKNTRKFESYWAPLNESIFDRLSQQANRCINDNDNSSNNNNNNNNNTNSNHDANLSVCFDDEGGVRLNSYSSDSSDEEV